MKRLTFNTPDTLILSAYFEEKHCGIKGMVRNGSGELIEQAMEYYSFGLASAIGAALNEMRQVGAKHCFIACNHKVLVRDFTAPIRLRLPQKKTMTIKPTKFEAMKLGEKSRKTEVPYAGNENQWNLLRELEWTYKGRWKFVHIDYMPGAQYIWACNHRIELGEIEELEW